MTHLLETVPVSFAKIERKQAMELQIQNILHSDPQCYSLTVSIVSHSFMKNVLVYNMGVIAYSGVQSPECDQLLKSTESANAPMKVLSERTKEMIVASNWHVPCHCIVTREQDGFVQAFHVQPNQFSASLLSYEQEQSLRKNARNPGTQAIAAFSDRAWYSTADRRELERFGVENVMEIKVDTNQWWRLLYNPATDEVWIDDKIHKKLFKYKGFGTTPSNTDVNTENPAFRALLGENLQA